MKPPHVTVVLPAYNASATLDRCVGSALGQSIGTAALEIIAVDDGSTDDTGPRLDRYAAAHPGTVRVVHTANSGGPSAPRNIGLGLAAGRYVFFLDSDDHLGREALERLVAMADANGSDVVLGRMRGLDGRGVPSTMFRRNAPRADLFRSRVYWTLSPLKLFRRSFLEALGLRFPEGVHYGEDQPFTARAYLNASVISVLADYDCYYAGRANLSLATANLATRLASLDTMLDLLHTELPPGRRRDTLLTRHMELGLQSVWRAMRGEPDAAVRQAAFDLLGPRVAAWSTCAAAKAMGPYYRRQWILVRASELDAVVDQVRVRDGRGTAASPLGFDPGTLRSPSRLLRLRLHAAGPPALLRKAAAYGLRRLRDALTRPPAVAGTPAGTPG